MALAVLAAGLLRAVLPPELRTGDARWVFIVVILVLLSVMVIGDPGRIDRDSAWLRALTGTLIGLISAVNASAAVRLVAGIIGSATFSNDANITCTFRSRLPRRSARRTSRRSGPGRSS